MDFWLFGMGRMTHGELRLGETSSWFWERMLGGQTGQEGHHLNIFNTL